MLIRVLLDCHVIEKECCKSYMWLVGTCHSLIRYFGEPNETVFWQEKLGVCIQLWFWGIIILFTNPKVFNKILSDSLKI